MFKYLFTAALGAAAALSLTIGDPGKSLTYYFKDLERRATRGEETTLEVLGLQVAYGGMVGVGGILYPEASEVLYEFCWGGGDDPEVESEYVRQSPFVRKKLAGLKPGQKWSGWYKQTEDVRLSYAFNPITIEKRRGGEIVVTSPIKVAPLGSGIYTRLYMGPLTFDLPDSLMRVACDEHEYTSVVRWKE
jgi:hypothetical protein